MLEEQSKFFQLMQGSAIQYKDNMKNAYNLKFSNSHSEKVDT